MDWQFKQPIYIWPVSDLNVCAKRTQIYDSFEKHAIFEFFILILLAQRAPVTANFNPAGLPHAVRWLCLFFSP